MSAVARLAEFVVKTTLEDCPSEAVARVRRAALDTLGVMLAGADEPVARIVRNVVRAEGGIALATVVGTTLKTAPGWAALANGAAGHAHDFDDTNFALLGHPSVPLLSTALAAAEAETAAGRALVLGYIIGFEIDVALGTALNPDHYTRGWHATSSIGTLGCAATAARIMGLDLVQTRHALAIAASHASGLKENFGSMTKPYHAGHAARNGLLAAQLAREGMTASETALEGRQGYASAFGGAARGFDQALEGLGRAWHLLGIRHRGQALPVVRPDAFGNRRAHRSSRRAPAEPARRRRGAGRRDPGRPRRARARATHDRARAEVLDAVLRRRRARRRPSRLRLVHRRRGRQQRDSRADGAGRDGGRPGAARGRRAARVEPGHGAAPRRAHLVDRAAGRAGASRYAALRRGAPRQVSGAARRRCSRRTRPPASRSRSATSKTSRTSAR